MQAAAGKRAAPFAAERLPLTAKRARQQRCGGLGRSQRPTATAGRSWCGSGAGASTGAGSGLLCDDDAYTWWCCDYGVDGEQIWFHTEPQLYYLHLDGADQTSGDYTLNVEFDEPQCGDGVVNPAPSGAGGAGGGPAGEECDDGDDSDPNDGCHQCQFIANPQHDTCPGEQLFLSPNVHFVLTGSTTSYSGDYEHVVGDQCSLPGQPPGRDRIYDLVPQVDGMLTASVGRDVTHSIDICAAWGPNDPGCWDRALYVYGPPNGCPNSQIACSDDANDPMAIEEISFPVVANEHYHVVIDSHDDIYPWPHQFYGTYSLHLELLP